MLDSLAYRLGILQSLQHVIVCFRLQKICVARKSREGTQIEKEEIFGHQREEDSMCVAETASLLHLLPELSKEDT